ncbi:MAG: M18 family aminopeptidase [Myxococcota bacterium]
MSAAATDLLRFIDRSPTPYHAVAEAVARLSAAGFQPLSEAELWDLSPGDARYVVRGGGSLFAFVVGERSPAEAGFHLVGAHTDSPNLRVKPLPDVVKEGARQLAVEPYGGVLLHTWLDRDLSLAGRVTVATPGGAVTRLVDFQRPLLRVPNLAIHLQRELRTEGLKLNAQQHAAPVIGLADAPPLAELLATELRAGGDGAVAASDVLGFDLMAYDVQPAARAGAEGELLFAPRLDNLASCHAALSALAATREHALPAWTNVAVLYDHEEVGSRSAQGAAGSFLADALGRLVASVKGGAPQGLARAAARSLLISADMAHAVHPNYVDKHEPGHRPRLGAGPVIKVNANQSYASDAHGIGHVTALCRSLGVTPQHFVTRSDLACGSTIGPIAAASVGVRTVDLGNPMLSMHSCRELAATGDVEPMIALLGAFYRETLPGEPS